MTNERTKILLSWSSGKDSAWALHTLRNDPNLEVCGLFTTTNGEAERVAMHGVRESLLERQAEILGLPLTKVPLPVPCTNAIYEERVTAALSAFEGTGITGMAFGDLFLEDVRAYRERQVEAAGLDGYFPIWGSDTRELAAEMVESGLRAILTCVDPKQVPPTFAGRVYDGDLLRDLPDSADPCGEKGEFHTLVFAGPGFDPPIEVEVGERVERGGFVFADVTGR